jgi:P27 family predicted phage terminase small subunit
MPGRKPKPTHLKLLQGNPGKRALNTNEPKPALELPSPPEHLSEIGRKEWSRLAEQLRRLGLLTAVDWTAFAAYCTVFSRWVDAEEALKKTGSVVKSPSGYPMISPFYTIANQSLQQLRAYLTEFGMTPSSRSRITLGGSQDYDPMEEFLFGQQ